MEDKKKIQSALISVYHKDGLEPVVQQLIRLGVTIYSTGGTAKYMEGLGADVVEVADLTGYPSILGGRVKTLHPKVHGGILAQRSLVSDQNDLQTYEIPTIDLVIVDLYPFEQTVAAGASEEDTIEKIDIGGIALIRAAAKNFEDVTVVPSSDYYSQLAQLLAEGDGYTSREERKLFAGAAFDVSSHYDSHIFRYLSPDSHTLKVSHQKSKALRYGENPHQSAAFYGDLTEDFEQLHGKELSYNNLVDVDAAVRLIDEFKDKDPTFVVIKHTNPCGCATADNMPDAWRKALAGDPVSAFGGILACNGTVDAEVAQDMAKLFFEVLIADDFTPEALEELTKKKKRILLKRNPDKKERSNAIKSILGGFTVQEKDNKHVVASELTTQTTRKPTDTEIDDILFGNTLVKHLKSNAIAIVKDKQLIGTGMGQTSRIDALRHCIAKAKSHGFEVKGSVLASDAFFPFSDSVEAAHTEGIEVVVEPGGSIRDKDSIEYCDANGMCLVFTGFRHFLH